MPPPAPWKGPGGPPPQAMNPAMAYQYQQQLNYQARAAGAPIMAAAAPYAGAYPMPPRGAVYSGAGMHYPYPQQHIPAAAQKSPRTRPAPHPISQPVAVAKTSPAVAAGGIGQRLSSGSKAPAVAAAVSATPRPLDAGLLPSCLVT